jgi:hypothetical protein
VACWGVGGCPRAIEQRIQLSLPRILANGEPLTESEKRLVVRASRFPMQFTKYGDFKVQSGRMLTGWERELVRAARRWPIAGEVLEG